MKKYIFVILLVLAGSMVYAQSSDRPLLRVQFNDRTPVAVAIDGRYYHKHGNSLTIGDLPQGRHHVKVYAVYTNGNGREDAHLVYEGSIKVWRGTYTTCTVNINNGSARIVKKDVSDADYSIPRNQYDHDFADRDAERNPTNDAANGNMNNGYTNAHADNAITRKDMTALQKNVEGRITDGDKMKLMKSVLQNRSYYTADMRDMLKWLNFESSRLEIAKWGYSNVIDKKEYWQLESEFTFSSSKDEFQSYIRSSR
ncbi:MAG: DUF4476 domain-containing protein [Taibaiella sp.]|nr:DUF4476 domain-containing protein [Taibaiella sp.]